MNADRLQRELASQRSFLDTVGRALGRGAIPAKQTPDGNEQFSALASRAGERTAAERLALAEAMRDNAAPARLMVELVSDARAVTSRVRELALERTPEWGETRSLCAWDDGLVNEMGLEAMCREAGLGYVPAHDPDFRRRSAEALLGVTGLDFIVAETGTMVLLSGPGRPRTASLLPSIHVAVAALDQIVADFPELYSCLGDMNRDGGLPPQLVFISGPSKTADIEACLVHGAHGPREAYLFVVTG